jgi:hypothetical protein
MVRCALGLALVLALAVATGCAADPGPQFVTTRPGTGTGPGTGGAFGGPFATDAGFGITGAAGFGSATTCGFGSGVGGSGLSPFPPQVGATISPSVAPPAISGGTLLVLKDGKTAVAADPDRDRIYVVDLVNRKLRVPAVGLSPGDEPGRVVEDADGRVHVALRGGGALVTLQPSTGAVLERRSVCAAPRGVAYDATADLVHVACAGGELVSFPAAGGNAVRTLKLPRDLRDVVVVGSELRVSRFRSAELLTVGPDGAVSGKTVPPAFRSTDVRNGQLFTSSVAWRTMALPSGGVVMLHQRGLVDEVQPAFGGYGSGFDTCGTIVHAAVTTVQPGAQTKSGPALAGLVMAVDMAISPDGKRLAVISAGNATNAEAPGSSPRLARVFVTDMQSATDDTIGCRADGVHAPCSQNGKFFSFDAGVRLPGGPDPDGGVAVPGNVGGADDGGMTPGMTPPPPPPTATPVTCDPSGASSDPALPEVVGQPIAVAFDASGNVMVQSREPAMLELVGGAKIQLSTESRQDTGHALFHANAGGGIACASCHAEGNEDGRIWNFSCEGARRTQSLQVGLKGTEPFHWGGDEKDFPQLVQDVFVGRMSGPMMRPDQVDATLRWIDAQPRIAKSPPADAAAVGRGRGLFNDTARAGCVTCHAGANLTNNTAMDVGTGGVFQVPSLVGISSHPPYMHDGCASTLRDRFGSCGGGDSHGLTSKLNATELSDLIAYIETL